MTTKDIASLTKKQREVLEWIAINEDGGHHPATLRALERKGFIESYEEQVYGRGNFDRLPVTIIRYSVPTPVHRAWAQWCAEQPGEEP